MKVYLKLDFKSAYLPTGSAFDNKEQKPTNPVKFSDVTYDYINDNKGNIFPSRVNRGFKTTMVEDTPLVADVLKFNQPITKSIVANVLAVLMGERPVPRMRNVSYELPAKALELAENSYIKILRTSEGEFMKTEKAYNDSDGTLQVPMWKMIEHHIGYDRIDGLRQYLTKYVPEADTEALCNIQHKFAECFTEMYNDPNIKELCNTSVTGILDMLTGLGLKKSSGEIVTKKIRGLHNNVVNNIPLLINKNGIGEFSCYDGSIIVELDKSDLALFKKGNGVATILDGGSVTIDGVYSVKNSEHNKSEFVDIQDIKHIEISNKILSQMTYFIQSFRGYMTDFRYIIENDKLTIHGRLKDYLLERKFKIKEEPLKPKERLSNFYERVKKENATEKNNRFYFPITR